MATNKLNLPTITHNQTADVPRDLNALANAVDAKAGAAGGLATLGPDGKVPATELAVDLTPIQNELSAHRNDKANPHATTKAQVGLGNVDDLKQATKAEHDTHVAAAASLTGRGHVQLSSSVVSTDETKAATSRAVKTAMDRADAAFTSASNGKTVVKNAVTGADPRVVVPTDPTFEQLATAVGQIQTGKKYAKGEVGIASSSTSLTVSGLDFKPRMIVIGVRGREDNALSHTFYSAELDSTRAYLAGTNQPYTLSSAGHYVTTGGFKLRHGGDSVYPLFWVAYE